MLGKDTAIVRYANVGRNILEENHDAGIVRQEIAVGSRLAFSLPIDAHQPIQHTPLNRRNHPDAFGLPDHRMPEAQNVPIRVRSVSLKFRLVCRKCFVDMRQHINALI